MNDYLFDRSGTPDPEVERLERLLGQLRHTPRPLVLPRALDRPAPAWRRLAIPLALAAAIVMMVAATWLWRPEPDAVQTSVARQAAGQGPWRVAAVRGTPRVGQSALEGESPVPAERWIETDAQSSARLSAGDVGRVELGPGSRVRVLAAAAGEHRLSLERGRLDAFIWAPPGRFFVETPSAVAINLGCAYTLEVDADGSGRLRVTAGWVGFESNGRESLVPAGALCATRPGRGPGTPHFEDASAAFVDGLAALDDGRDAGGAALNRVLHEARPRDALSLWHLLSRVGSPAAGRVYDRLAAIAPPPADATRPRVLARDREALDAWWDTFGLGEAAYFRMWSGR